MAFVVTHTFVSAVADGADATVVRPSNWNANHTLSMNSGFLLGRGTAGVGAPEEITLGTGLSFTGTTLNSSGGAPGNPSLSVQFNNAGAFAGMGGTSWDDTNRALTVTGATVTANHPILDVTQTWNNGAVQFFGLRLAVTNTASAGNSRLLDLLNGVTSAFNVSIGGDAAAFGTVAGATLSSSGNINLTSGTGNLTWIGNALLTSDGAGTIAQRNGANAQSFRVYNTFTDLSNFERGVIDWTTTANTLTIGAQALGTGTLRNTQIVGAVAQVIPGVELANQSMAIPAAGRVVLWNGAVLGWANSGTATVATTNDTSLSRTVASVVRVGDGAGNSNGWLQWAGELRVTGDVNNATTVLATATGLSVALIAGRTYSFDVHISWTDAAAGGIQAAMVASGGLTATNIIYDGWIVDSAANGIKGNAQATALGGVVASSTTTGTAGHLEIHGTITVNVAGTINVQFAQNTGSATNTTVKRGSYMLIYDMP